MKSSQWTANACTNYTTRRPTITQTETWRALPVGTERNSWANTRSASASHGSGDTSFHQTHYPSGDRSEVPPPRGRLGLRLRTTWSAFRPNAWWRHVSVLMTDLLMLTAGIRKIKASTATGRDKEKNSCKTCCARARDGSNNALSVIIIVLRP